MVASPSPTNVQDVLQLRDIHLPVPIGWWPLAPGWYALLALMVLGLGSVIYLLLLRKRQRVKREALRLLKSYEHAFQQEGIAVEVVCAQISELLRRVSLYYYPRENIAGLQGETWLQFLQDTTRKKVGSHVHTDVARFRLFLLDKPYQAPPQVTSSSAQKQDEIVAFLEFAKQWIIRRKHHV